MGTLKIERLGGIAGFGLPGSKIRSRGEHPIEALSADDQASVEGLFRNPPSAHAGHERDTFRYRLTRTRNGKDETVEVPEAAVPASLKACVSDQLM